MPNLSGLILAVLLAAPAAAVQAGGYGGCTDGCCTSGGCEVQCPQCNHTCKLSVSVEKEAKTCYSSECKPVCIPKIVFPWQKKAACCDSGCGCTGSAGDGCCGSEKCCSANNGACVRYVNVLKKFEYQCDACKYKWEALQACCPGNGSGCSDSGMPAPPSPAADMPTPADEQDMLPPVPPPVTRRAPIRQIQQASGVLKYYE